MDFKHSKFNVTLPPPTQEWLNCSEALLQDVARPVLAYLQSCPGGVLLLEGPMGAGKSTFARQLLSLWWNRPLEASKGSPTFPLLHEYVNAKALGQVKRLLHIDLYRLKGDDELEAAGIDEAVWNSADAIKLIEWSSQFPRWQQSLVQSPPWGEKVGLLQLSPGDRPEFRNIRWTALK